MGQGASVFHDERSHDRPISVSGLQAALLRLDIARRQIAIPHGGELLTVNRICGEPLNG